MENRIEKQTQIDAPVSRVWRALTDAAEFGEWFRVKLDGPFVVGQSVRGQITYPKYEHLRIDMTVKAMTPETYFAYTWHPYPMDPSVDYTLETPTLVEFRLADVAGGTSLTVVESGFEHIPSARRDEAFRSNSSGWAGQMENIKAYVTSHS